MQRVLDATHLEGALKAEILADPERYVILDEELPLALLELKRAGKKLLLITNSEWSYTQRMMSYAFDRFLPKGTTWRDLFDVVIVQARKPEFFARRAPVFRLVDEQNRYTPHVGALEGGRSLPRRRRAAGRASLGVEPDHILYVGDHIFADVHVSKDLLRWRTALVVRELERELEGLAAFRAGQAQLDALDGREGPARAPAVDAAPRCLRNTQQPPPGFDAERRQRRDPRAAQPPRRARSAHRAARQASQRAAQRRAGARSCAAATTRATSRARSSATPTSTRRASRTCSRTRRSPTCARRASTCRTRSTW